MPPKCRIVRRSYPTTDLQQAWKRKETKIRRTDFTDRTRNFTPLIFTTTEGMAPECQMFHSRLAELIATKEAEEYSNTMNWLRVKISFSLIKSALVCLRGSRCLRRRPYSEFNEVDIDTQTVEGRIG